KMLKGLELNRIFRQAHPQIADQLGNADWSGLNVKAQAIRKKRKMEHI
ncbi:hypothetical protein MNBD_ALPHA04-2093, partial [hydrothermal vent metagenome]